MDLARDRPHTRDHPIAGVSPCVTNRDTPKIARDKPYLEADPTQFDIARDKPSPTMSVNLKTDPTQLNIARDKPFPTRTPAHTNVVTNHITSMSFFVHRISRQEVQEPASLINGSNGVAHTALAIAALNGHWRV